MKRILSIVAAGLLLVSSAGCAGGQTDELEDTTGTSPVEESERDEAPQETLQYEVIQTEEPQNEKPQGEQPQDEANNNAIPEEADGFTFTLDGVAYQFPCPYKSFAANGWDIADAAYTESTSINGYESENVGISKDGNYVKISVTNPSETPQTVGDCEVRGIAVTRGCIENGGTLSIGDDVTLESSTDNITEAMDLTFDTSGDYNYARRIEESSNGDSTRVEFFWYDDEPERNSIFVRFTRDGDNITANKREYIPFPNIYDRTDAVNIEVPDELSSSEMAAFVQFLQGSSEASLSDPSQYSLSYVSFGQAGQYTLESLRDAVNANTNTGYDPWGYDGLPFEKIYYGIWDTLSGGKVLAVKFQNMGIYEAMDNSYALFVFAVKEGGALEMTYAYDSWCRSPVEILNGGTFSGIGDGGTAKSSWFGLLDAAGQYQEVYNRCTEYNAGFSVTWISTLDGEFYTYETDGTNQDGVDLCIAEMEDQGISYTDNIDSVIQTAYAAFDIDLDVLHPYDTWTLWTGK